MTNIPDTMMKFILSKEKEWVTLLQQDNILVKEQKDFVSNKKRLQQSKINYGDK